MTELRDQAEQISEDFSAHDPSITPADIEDRLSTLVTEYKVPIDEAVRSVRNHYADQTGVDRDTLGGAATHVQLAEIDEPDRWVDVTTKVVELWEPRSESIDQVGLLGDESGTIKFTKWAKSNLSRLEENHVYRLGNVVTDEYQGRFSVKLNRTTTIEEVDEDIEVGTNELTVTGALVDIQSGSGLIKRCPESDCSRVLQNGRCAEHGEVDGQFDLRIKGILDDGDQVHEILFDQDATEALTDITLETAKEMAMDALDTSVVADEIRNRILGRYYRVTGPRFNRYILVNDAATVDDALDPEAVLIKARSMA